MKILITAIMLLGLLISSDTKENKSKFVRFECQAGSSDYCSGFADGREKPGDPPSTWTKTYNKCMVGRGCAGETLPISQ
jgi:hypothetical protein